MSKKNYLFANWKMYLKLSESKDLAEKLAKRFKKMPVETEMAVFPSAFSFQAVKKELKGSDILLGAQNAYWLDKGGYTGEVSVFDYREEDATYCLVGHSERRHQFGETDEDVAKKMEAVLESGLTPVLCVGETLRQKDSGQTKEIVAAQLESALSDLKIEKNQKIIIAYEPVWAIGTGKTCDVSVAQETAAFIKEVCENISGNGDISVLYGGSVKGDNALSFADLPDIDGLLVGGSSAKMETWEEIFKAVCTI